MIFFFTNSPVDTNSKIRFTFLVLDNDLKKIKIKCHDSCFVVLVVLLFWLFCCFCCFSACDCPTWWEKVVLEHLLIIWKTTDTFVLAGIKITCIKQLSFCINRIAVQLTVKFRLHHRRSALYTYRTKDGLYPLLHL